MVTMSKQKPDRTEKKKRNAIFITLDGPAEEALERFRKSQRVAPDRAAVAYTALVEFLEKVGFPVREEK